MPGPGRLRGGTIPVTSHDVAAAAGVSQPTVSRALRNDPNIAEPTRQRVVEAARALGYVPNELGRSLSTRATRRVALVTDLDNPLWPLLVDQVHDELSKHAYSMTLLAERGDPADLETNLLSGWADGVIITSARTGARLPQELSRRGIPYVLVNRTIGREQGDASVADNVDGGRLAAQMLLDAGHRRFGALFGPADTSTGRDRERGFRDALDQAGHPLRDQHVAHGPFAWSHGREALPEVLRGRDRPTALFCANDIIAIGAMNTAHELGLSVPGDLALVGFDDLEEAAWPLLQLSTIRVPFAEMVRSAISMLLERLGGLTSPARLRTAPVEAVPRRTHLRGPVTRASRA